jgi:hypothetical protein
VNGRCRGFNNLDCPATLFWSHSLGSLFLSFGAVKVSAISSAVVITHDCIVRGLCWKFVSPASPPIGDWIVSVVREARGGEFCERGGRSSRMRREGRVGGKPTNHSKKTGKCRVVGCETCHDSLPLNKSRGKGKGRIKRLVSDIPSTHLLSDWRVSKPGLISSRLNGSRKIVQRPVLKWDPDTDWAGDEDDVDAGDGVDGGVEPEGWALSISLLLDTALEHIQESVEARSALQKAREEAAEGQEDVISPHVEDTDDENTDEAEVPDFEAFKNEFEVFKSEIEAGCSPPSVAESTDSWSGIELSDADESSLGDWEDDWSLVEDVIAV